MKIRCLLASLVFALPLAAEEKPDPAKEALKALNEYVGTWKGNGETKTPKAELWKESAEWGWDLKGKEPALSIKFTGSKQLAEGRLTYLADKKKFQLAAKTVDKKEQVYLGEIKSKKLILVHDDAASKDKYTIEMSTNNDGARFVYTVAMQPKGKGIAKRLAEVALTKEGVSLAGGKKNECIVTGGLGTMSVMFGGKTYYVCCSGCLDEFNANPKKYIAEWEKANKK